MPVKDLWYNIHKMKMKSLLPIAVSTVLPFVATCDVTVSSNAVSFTAVSTDCGIDTQLEFLFAGPGSDRDYESMFLTDDDVGKIADAFAKAGMPIGKPVSQSQCRFWPIGTKVAMEPDIWTLVRDMRNERRQSVVWTGGSREGDGRPVAATNMPLAVFALYNCPQSLMQFDDALDQSATYGRFQPAVKIPKGERRRFTFRWGSETNGGKHELTPDFPDGMSVGEAIKLATALDALDSPETKVNGFRDGQFFYKAFLPLEKWRDRKERLTQPYEVKFRDGKPILTVITEDWSNPDSSDPKLTAKEVSFDSIPKEPKVDTCLVFTTKAMKLGEVYSVAKLLPKSVVNWYVFGD